MTTYREYIKYLVGQIRQKDKIIDKLRPYFSTGCMASNYLHDVTTEMSILSMSLTRLLQSIDKGTTEPELVQEVTFHFELIRMLHKNMKAFSVLNTGQKVRPIDDCVQSVLKYYSPSMFRKHRIDFKIIVSDKASKVRVPCQLVSSILIQLLSNAFEALETIHRKGKMIILKICTTPNRIFVFMKNNGPRIPEEYIDRIWEPSFTTKKDATGLGLSIVRQEVDEMKGNIRVISNKDNTTFVVSFLRNMEGIS